MNYFIDIENEKVLPAPSYRTIIDEFKGVPNWCKENGMNYTSTYSTEAMFEVISYKEYDDGTLLTPYGEKIAKDRIKATEILKRLNISNYRKEETKMYLVSSQYGDTAIVTEEELAKIKDKVFITNEIK